MSSNKLREEFLNFFQKRGHKIVPTSSLLPTDPSVLFTTAGMQQFKEYFLGKKSPHGDKVTSCQKCFRTSDIEEVGDDTHLTFLEMLGNFSFGDYFKKEAIKMAYEFLFQELKLPIEDAAFTVFEGDPSTGSGQVVPCDEEAISVWKKLGIPSDKIKKCGRKDNFWGPTGEEGPCGPTTEIHIRGTEVWNLVFNEYYQDKNKKLTPLKQKGVDTGMGLERLAMAVQGKSSVFETDLFQDLIERIRKQCNKETTSKADDRIFRVIADHVRGSIFLISDGVTPLNVERGYILRRIIRRTLTNIDILRLSSDFIFELARQVIQIYQDVYPEIKSKENDILTIMKREVEKFERTKKEGEKEFEKVKLTLEDELSGEEAFRLYSTYGFSLEEMKKGCKKVDEKGFWEAFKKHQEVSRAGAEKKFGGGGEFSPKLHTATHLLHAALREVLGKEVKQMGSDINPSRLRFDFSYPAKMTQAEIGKVEAVINQKIKEDLPVNKKEMTLDEALKAGALAFFKEKYPEKVTVYSVDNFSKEICAGPHVARTSDLGVFKITKEESSGAGVRRIRAILE